VGIQHDLAEAHIGEWIPDFRSALPQTALYVEADYSAQMCSDLIAGSLDLGMMFSPSLHPDLHFETLGEVAYRMIAPDRMDVRSVIPEAYVLANYSAAFARAHDALHPTLGVAAASSGHGASVTALALALGWAAYVPDHTARALIGAGRAAAVSGAAVILQTVHAGIHVRHRHRGMHRRLLSLLRVQFPALRPGPLV
jgi:hypothetical protein